MRDRFGSDVLRLSSLRASFERTVAAVGCEMVRRGQREMDEAERESEEKGREGKKKEKEVKIRERREEREGR
jgi:hypothetical protein